MESLLAYLLHTNKIHAIILKEDGGYFMHYLDKSNGPIPIQEKYGVIIDGEYERLIKKDLIEMKGD